MILLFFFELMNRVGYWMLTFMPDGDVLPWGMDSVVGAGIGYVRALGEIFPPLRTLLTVVIIYMAFRLGLLVAKIILGSRAPVTK